MIEQLEKLSRLWKPKSIAVIGGGHWCYNVIRRCQEMGYPGLIWSVHPNHRKIADVTTHKKIVDLPHAPDAAFVGVNKQLTIGIVAELAAKGAGGAVCFASGFEETQDKTKQGARLQKQLVASARRMRLLGPNCYGYLNCLDRVGLWPDYHGCKPISQGVAIISQSSNIALNITMQKRALPLAYVITVGNGAQTNLSEIGLSLLKDRRVSALGLYIEGIDDLTHFCRMAQIARDLGKGIVVIKSGDSALSKHMAMTHTASLAGTRAGAQALFERLGIGIAYSLTQMIETLKILHVAGSLQNKKIISLSCSGGEAGLIADRGMAYRLSFPPFNLAQKKRLSQVLGSLVSPTNPLDYHTFIWGDRQALYQCFLAAFASGQAAIGCVILDYPRAESCSFSLWNRVVDALAKVKKETGKTLAIIATLSDNMPEAVAMRIMKRGLIAQMGLDDSLSAIAIAANIGKVQTTTPLLPPPKITSIHQQPLKDAKQWLVTNNISTPKMITANSVFAVMAQAANVGFPAVLKAADFLHKTEANAVILNIENRQALKKAALSMPSKCFALEAMIKEGIFELLIGVLLDPAHGYTLTIAAGGIWTEILKDCKTLLIPATKQQIKNALMAMRCYTLLCGYRQRPKANIQAIVETVAKIQQGVIDFNSSKDKIVALEINPLICTPKHVVAVDILMKTGDL